MALLLLLSFPCSGEETEIKVTIYPGTADWLILPKKEDIRRVEAVVYIEDRKFGEGVRIRDKFEPILLSIDDAEPILEEFRKCTVDRQPRLPKFEVGEIRIVTKGRGVLTLVLFSDFAFKPLMYSVGGIRMIMPDKEWDAKSDGTMVAIDRIRTAAKRKELNKAE